MALPRPSAGFFRACRLGILLIIFVFATLLQHLCVSAAELHHNSATISITHGNPHVHYYLRGKLIAVDAAAAQQEFVGHGGRNLKEMSSSFEAESVEVADYSPCANNKHDPSLCKSP